MIRLGRWQWTFLFLAAYAAQAVELIPLDAEGWRWRKGTQEASLPDTTAWRQVGFNDASWTSSPAPFWYGDVQPAPGTQIDDMQFNYGTLFLRKTFTVNNPGDISEMQLGAVCDDGFIAWINGTPVQRYNVPEGELSYGDFALQFFSEPVPFENYLLDNPRRYLRTGENVLAVMVFNVNLGSSDIIFNASLNANVDDQPPVVATLIPDAYSTVRRLAEIEVDFSETVAGVDAADLLINGTPATNVVEFAPGQFQFTFPMPPTGRVDVAWVAGHGIHDLAGAANPFAGGSWYYTVNPNAPVPGVIISEFMADDNRTLRDDEGDKSDWIELYNSSGAAVNLSGWYLTDTTNLLTRWRFPSVSLASKAYLLIYASGKDHTNAAAPLHTSFKLKQEGGYLALSDNSGSVVSEFTAYPRQYEDVAYGRDRVAPEVVGYFSSPTPGAANSTSGAGFAPEVKFSADSGTFYDPFALVLSTADTNAEIRYVLGTNAVTQSATLYTGPISITNTVHVRARAFYPGLLPSAPHTETYVRLASALLPVTSDLPIMVLHNLGKGTVPGSAGEQFVTVQVFEPKNGVSSLTNAPDTAGHGIFHKRGSSTQGMAKASFFLEVRDAYDNDRDVPLAGLPEESDWVLYAPNYFEPAMMHNPMAYALSREVGPYAPRTRFVEVYLKDDSGTPGALTSADYNGVYVLEEKIKIGKNRVNIDKLRPEQTTQPRVSGGYLLSIDRSAPDTWPTYMGGASINYLDPDFFEMESAPWQAQRSYIESYFNSFFTALNAANWTDPVLGYRAYIDLPSWLDHHIVNVVTFNVDALRLSGYFYKPRNGKIEMGPVWDFDRTQGSADGRDFNPRTWRSPVPDYGTDMFNSDGIFENPWYSRMFRDIDFWQNWVDRYQELRHGALHNTNIFRMIDGFANEVRKAQPREVARWGESTPRSGAWGSGGYSYNFPGTYQGEIDFMKLWYSNRLDFIDTNFVARPEFSRPGGLVPAGTTISITGPGGGGFSGTVFYTVDGTDPRQPGGVRSATSKGYLDTIRVTQNVRLVARAWDQRHANLTGANNPPLTTPWSGAIAATYYVQVPELVISEIMYHPAAPGVTDTNDADAFEYVELLNRGTNALDLSGFHFSEGIAYTFSSTSGVTRLEPGGRVLVVRNLAAFQNRYPGVTNVAGEFTGALDNAGERLALMGPLEEPIHDFSYNNSWYRLSDGLGFSLVVKDPQAALSTWANLESWRLSAAVGGSPGAADPDPAAQPPLLVNEALTHTDLPAVDAVELHNPTAADVDLAGWWLSDDFTTPFKYLFPTNSIVPAHGFLVVEETAFGAGANGFGLSSLGDEAYLFSGDGVHLTGYYHGYSFGAAGNGVSFGRHMDSLGREHFVPQAAVTLGRTNAAPHLGPLVISELMYQPPLVGTNNNRLDEYVELQNLAATPVPLFDPAFPTNTWRIGGGIDFHFPTNVTLAAKSCLLLVNFDPDLEPAVRDAFVGKYAVATNVPLFGPYQGSLKNTGDRVTLSMPDTPELPSSPDAGLVPHLRMDEVDFESSAPWPDNAAASGKSLHRTPANVFGDDPASWVAAAPTAGQPEPVGSSPETDSDGDGMPDAWETHHGFDLHDPSDALQDADDDGLTNLQEYLAGTDPHSAASTLGLGMVVALQGPVKLQFSAVAGRTYRLESRENLTAGGWSEVKTVGPVAADGLTEIEDTRSPTETRYYRLVLP